MTGCDVACKAEGARLALRLFCAASAFCFVAVATRRQWARDKAALVEGPLATIVFYCGAFVVVVVLALGACELQLGGGATEAFRIAQATSSMFFGAVLGFHAAMWLDPEIKALLPAKGLAVVPPAHDALPPTDHAATPVAGLKKLGPTAGALCWVCGQDKTSHAHLAGCPAAKGGLS